MRLFLPGDVGTRVEVEAGPTTIQAAALSRGSNTYNKAAYGVSAVTLRGKMETGIGQISPEVED